MIITLTVLAKAIASLPFCYCSLILNYWHYLNRKSTRNNKWQRYWKGSHVTIISKKDELNCILMTAYLLPCQCNLNSLQPLCQNQKYQDATILILTQWQSWKTLEKNVFISPSISSECKAPFPLRHPAEGLMRLPRWVLNSRAVYKTSHKFLLCSFLPL